MTPLYTQPLGRSNLANPASAPAPASPPAVTRPAFYLTVVFIFVVYGRFPEMMDVLTGSPLHWARIVVGLALLATLLFGGDIWAIFSKSRYLPDGFCALDVCVCRYTDTFRWARPPLG